MRWVITEVEDQEINLICCTNTSSLFQQVAWAEVSETQLMLSSSPSCVAAASLVGFKERFLLRMHWKPRKQKN